MRESSNTSNVAAPVANTASPATDPRRRRGLTLIALAVVVAGIGWGGWHWLAGRHHEVTDNAYVGGNVVQITAQVGGTVVAIQADDTDFVQAGQTLVKLDPADARVALEQAEAQLAQSVRDVRTLFANNSTLAAQVKLRQADVARAKAEVAKAQDDVNRRAPLLVSGAVGKEEYNHTLAQRTAAESTLAAAESGAQGAQDQLLGSQTQTDGTTVAEHPAVLRAAAKVREAYLALQRTELVAPIDGQVAKRGVQLGQRVQAGAPLMALVQLDTLWVDANFKESQLQALRAGQPAELQADVYGKNITFHGTVVGLGAGTGSAFSLLPAQNATGNWIKVVQRVPVRIALDPDEIKAHPLRVGLSMEATVDTQAQDGQRLSDASPHAPLSHTTPVFDAQQRAADAEVQRVLSSALGHKLVAAAVAVPSVAGAPAVH
jgi:membrane fusion protein (multidrug efflux system)